MNKEAFCLKFTLNKDGELFSAVQENVTVMHCTVVDGMLDFWILYDYNKDVPLHLAGKVKSGDEITINILPYRIELYIGDFLADEEWPCGNHYIPDATEIQKNCDLDICALDIEKVREPNVLGSFQNAEGWKPEENVFVGDCMPYCYDGAYHVLYLKDRHQHKSKWGKGAHQWSHISTRDFVNWDMHPMAVEIDDPAEGSICTGSWICLGTTHYLFYTVRSCDNSPAKICRSVSDDGFHFEKDRNYAFVLSDKYTANSARDPKIIKADDGLYHMILTTSLKEEQRGCLAHLISENLNDWTECEQVIYIAPENQGEPECPDYFYKDGYYYLVYSLKGRGFYLYSEKPFTDWQTPENPVIPCKCVPKAAIWNDRLIFTGFHTDKGYGGTMTFLEAVVQENGELAYEKLD
ncbi:MAG: hypothetical protein IKJ55_00380 [Clostridia bacterium]|nr:hypothetical protein [Clostridia bacterium]